MILSYIVFFNLTIDSNLWEDYITIVIYQVAEKSKYIVFVISFKVKRKKVITYLPCC